MLKRMISQIPLSDNHYNTDCDELKLFELMNYYNNEMNTKEFLAIAGNKYEQNEADCLKIV